jgi:hypothetical protein
VQIRDRRHLSAGQVERGDRLVDLAQRISLLPQIDHVLVRGIELRELLDGGLGAREGPGWSSMNPRNKASRVPRFFADCVLWRSWSVASPRKPNCG